MSRRSVHHLLSYTEEPTPAWVELKRSFFCVCGGCGCAHPGLRLWRSEVNVRCLPLLLSILFFWDRVLSDPGAVCQLVSIACNKCPWWEQGNEWEETGNQIWIEKWEPKLVTGRWTGSWEMAVWKSKAGSSCDQNNRNRSELNKLKMTVTSNTNIPLPSIWQWSQNALMISFRPQ